MLHTKIAVVWCSQHSRKVQTYNRTDDNDTDKQSPCQVDGTPTHARGIISELPGGKQFAIFYRREEMNYEMQCKHSLRTVYAYMHMVYLAGQYRIFAPDDDPASRRMGCVT